MQEAIKERRPIHIRSNSENVDIFSGICLKASPELILLVNYNSEDKAFDGFVFLPGNNVADYRDWTEKELEEMGENNASNYFNVLPLAKLNDARSLLSFLQTKPLCSLFVKGEDDDFYVGKILKNDHKRFEMQLISPDAEWEGKESFKYKDIEFMEFGTRFEEELANQID